MNYLVWRQHRNQLGFAALGLALLAVILVPTGVHLASAYSAAIKGCGSPGTCTDVGTGLFANYGLLFDLIGLTAVVPALFGLFWGAPLVAAEIEAGTQLLAWTQTVTRRRWLAVKTAWMLAAAAVWGAAISLLVTWWSGPVNAVDQSRFSLGHFDTQGLVPVGYAVFAVALGIGVGAIARRVLPALAMTLGVFTAVRFAIDYVLRPHYLAPRTVVFPLGSQSAPPSGSYWPINSSILDASGNVFDKVHLVAASFPAACRSLLGSAPFDRCLGSHGWKALVEFQPANRFWTFQAIETAIYLALAAVLVLVAFVAVERHDA